jgi:excisionase family DNA binding protein
MFYTIKEIATMLKVHETTVRRWILDGKLESVKVGNTVRVSGDDFRRFVNAK